MHITPAKGIRSQRIRLGRGQNTHETIRTLLVMALISALSVFMGLAVLQAQVDSLGVNAAWGEQLAAMPEHVQRSLRLTLYLCLPGGGIAAMLALAGLLLRMRSEAVAGTPKGLWWRKSGHLHAQTIPWSQIVEISPEGMAARLGPHDTDPRAQTPWTMPLTHGQLQALRTVQQAHTEQEPDAPDWLANSRTEPPPVITASLTAYPRGFGLRAGGMLLTAALLTPLGSTLGMLLAIGTATITGTEVGWAATAGSSIYPVGMLILALVLTMRAGRPVPSRLILGHGELTVQAPSLPASIEVSWVEVLEVLSLDDRLRLYLAPEVGLRLTDNLGRGVVDVGRGTDGLELNQLAVELRKRIEWQRSGVLVPAAPTAAPTPGMFGTYAPPASSTSHQPEPTKVPVGPLSPIPSIDTPEQASDDS